MVMIIRYASERNHAQRFKIRKYFIQIIKLFNLSKQQHNYSVVVAYFGLAKFIHLFLQLGFRDIMWNTSIVA
ncbi:unnamed protein product [Paramecium octaurelia]|uniref:Uncharacterized protein n=1 Tax=Paramecium octaurelia TaxID=43137 RepID=A0A8S1V2W8_PAROT|nr:unnamed protein product [Paramecium octaurelia]